MPLSYQALELPRDGYLEKIDALRPKELGFYEGAKREAVKKGDEFSNQINAGKADEAMALQRVREELIEKVRANPDKQLSPDDLIDAGAKARSIETIFRGQELKSDQELQKILQDRKARQEDRQIEKLDLSRQAAARAANATAKKNAREETKAAKEAQEEEYQSIIAKAKLSPKDVNEDGQITEADKILAIQTLAQELDDPIFNRIAAKEIDKLSKESINPLDLAMARILSGDLSGLGGPLTPPSGKQVQSISGYQSE